MVLFPTKYATKLFDTIHNENTRKLHGVPIAWNNSFKWQWQCIHTWKFHMPFSHTTIYTCMQVFTKLIYVNLLLSMLQLPLATIFPTHLCTFQIFIYTSIFWRFFNLWLSHFVFLIQFNIFLLLVYKMCDNFKGILKFSLFCFNQTNLLIMPDIKVLYCIIQDRSFPCMC